MSFIPKKTVNFLEEILASAAEAIRPAERMTVSQAAEEYRYLNNPGSYVGKWDNDIAPYLVEIMDTLTSREFTGLGIVGPARCGKSDMFFNWLAYTAKCDPADMMLVHMTQSTARDWSIGDLRKVFRHSPKIGDMVLSGRQHMNVHDVRFINGMRLLVKWPTINELSGKTIPRLWLMDYERMPLDVDKEGSPFELAQRRTKTFGRFGMTVAESSPGNEISNPKWRKTTAHEAPPAPGILTVYNQGDRRRYYWRCINPRCRLPFEPDFENLRYPDSRDFMEAAQACRLHCPHCDFPYTFEAGPGQPGRAELNLKGKWIKDGMLWMDDGSVKGNPIRSNTASFWIKGPHACFQTWEGLVFKYLTAMDTYNRTGDTQAIKVTVNTDQGRPFIGPSTQAEHTADELRERAIDIGDKVVPEDFRFLIATVDVQKHSFVVQVHAVNPQGDFAVIDRFLIKHSKRRDQEDPTQILWVAPGTYKEDWHVLIENVIERTYPLGDDSGRRMKIKAVISDSGGREAATSNAYAFWRYLKDTHPGQHHRMFHLLKGASEKGAPRVRITYPDSERQDRRAAARGEVPVLLINTDLIKDHVNGMLGRKESGGQIVFPEWMPEWFYDELTVEVKTHKGWENPKKLRNEAWDLLCYAYAASIHPRFAGIETIDWGNPPHWARPWDQNSYVFAEEEYEDVRQVFAPRKEDADDFDSLVGEFG